MNKTPEIATSWGGVPFFKGLKTASILKVPRPWTISNLEFVKSVVDVLCKKVPALGKEKKARREING